MAARWLLTPFVSVFNAMTQCTYGSPSRGVSPPARVNGTVSGDDWDTVSQESEEYQSPPFPLAPSSQSVDIDGRLQYAISVYNLSEAPQPGITSDEEGAWRPEWVQNATHSASRSSCESFRAGTRLGRPSRIRRRNRCCDEEKASQANSSRHSSRLWRPENDEVVQPCKRAARRRPHLNNSRQPLNRTDGATETTTPNPSRQDPRDLWKANAGLPLRPTKANDWSALQRQLLDWNVPKFSGGLATWRPLRAARLGPRAVLRCDPSAEGTGGFAQYRGDMGIGFLNQGTPDTAQSSGGALETSSCPSSNSDEAVSLRRDENWRGVRQRGPRVQRNKSGATGGFDLSAASSSDSDVGEEDSILRTYTPRQRRLHASVYPPKRCFEAYPTGTAWASPLKPKLFQGLTRQEEQKALTKMFKTFVVELTRGAYFTQLAGGHQYFTLHCQLTETLDSLTIDANSGERIEFPLLDVVRVFRVNRPVEPQSATTCDRARVFGSPATAFNKRGVDNSGRHRHSIPRLDLTALVAQPDLLVVLQFETRKRLAFVFKDPVEADQFCLCLDLLIEHVREKNSGAVSWFDLTKRQDRQTRPEQRKAGSHARCCTTARLRYRRCCPSSSCRCYYIHPCPVSRRRCCCYWSENFLPVGSVIKNGWTATPASSSFEGFF